MQSAAKDMPLKTANGARFKNVGPAYAIIMKNTATPNKMETILFSIYWGAPRITLVSI